MEINNRASVRVEEAARKVEERLARAASDAGREIRSAGGMVAIAGKEAGAALSAGAADATGHISGATFLVNEAASKIGVETKALAATVRDWRPVSDEAAAMVARAGAVLDAAAARMTEASTSLEVLGELRAAAALLAGLSPPHAGGRTEDGPTDPGIPAAGHAGEV